VTWVIGRWKEEGRDRQGKMVKSGESGESVRVRGECGYIYTPFAPLVEA